VIWVSAMTCTLYCVLQRGLPHWGKSRSQLGLPADLQADMQAEPRTMLMRNAHSTSPQLQSCTFVLFYPACHYTSIRHPPSTSAPLTLPSSRIHLLILGRASPLEDSTPARPQCPLLCAQAADSAAAPVPLNVCLLHLHTPSFPGKRHKPPFFVIYCLKLPNRASSASLLILLTIPGFQSVRRRADHLHPYFPPPVVQRPCFTCLQGCPAALFPQLYPIHL
jgi:hypothetical protein